MNDNQTAGAILLGIAFYMLLVLTAIDTGVSKSVILALIYAPLFALALYLVLYG